MEKSPGVRLLGAVSSLVPHAARGAYRATSLRQCRFFARMRSGSPGFARSPSETWNEKMGRIRRERWGPRLIDLDLLFFGEMVISGQGLEVPHPRLHERRFVLTPLVEIAPDVISSYPEKVRLRFTGRSSCRGPLGREIATTRQNKVFAIMPIGRDPCIFSLLFFPLDI